MRRLWLVGLPGSGKSTVGRAVAERLGVAFTDTDRIVETANGRSVAEIWLEIGEAGFRAAESAVIASLESAEGVISTGGGAVLDEDNRAAMTGTVIWLNASAETVAARIGVGDDRPLLGGDTYQRVDDLASRRRSLYQAIADHIVVVDDRSVDDVVAEVVQLWNG
jgi:shikimate kinase